MDSHALVVLGAPDPEMDAIEALAIAAGLPVAYATATHPSERGGPRVIPTLAYSTTALVWPDAGRANIPPGAWYPRQIIAVECGFPAPGEQCSPAELEFWGHGGSPDPELITIDHHRPGDPGFGHPPSNFLPASSVGQVVAWMAAGGWPVPGSPLPPVGANDPGMPPGAFGSLDSGSGWFVAARGDEHYEVDRGVVLTAAADHCLAAAYAGQCPGVDPSALRRHRVECVLTRTDGFGRPGSRAVAEVEAQLAGAIGDLGIAPRVNIGGASVCDLRGRKVRDLPEVACLLGVAYLADAPGRPGERPKAVLGGCGEGTAPGTAPVEAFLGGWAAEQGLVDPYGDPARGFAGAYLP